MRLCRALLCRDMTWLCRARAAARKAAALPRGPRQAAGLGPWQAAGLGSLGGFAAAGKARDTRTRARVTRPRTTINIEIQILILLACCHSVSDMHF